MKLSHTRITIESYKETKFRIDIGPETQTAEPMNLELSQGGSGVNQPPLLMNGEADERFSDHGSENNA